LKHRLTINTQQVSIANDSLVTIVQTTQDGAVVCHPKLIKRYSPHYWNQKLTGKDYFFVNIFRELSFINGCYYNEKKQQE